MKQQRPTHCVPIRYKPPTVLNEIKNWCADQFGDGDFDSDGDEHSAWVCYWSGPQVEYGTEYKFWFAEHKDAMLFALRWL